MSSGQAIKAVEMFTKNGASKNVSVAREVVIGLTIGLGFGALWKVRPEHCASPLRVQSRLCGWLPVRSGTRCGTGALLAAAP